jgi:hypothetical protein
VIGWALASAAPTAIRAGGESHDSTVRAIDAACASAARVAAAAQTFIAIFDGGRADGTWRRGDATAMRRIASDPDIYSETARVWFARGRVARVEIVANSLDFGARTAYCFRPSGTLARAVETSSGTTNADRESRYLDEGGRVIARSSRIALLAPAAGRSPSPDVKPALIDLYARVASLPFARLLPRL